ncbi:MAG: hypothetical protein JKY67_22930 [Pseudomonadales bacterium]|nr:hypothetical protein [Pseudomonadales bacterium]
MRKKIFFSLVRILAILLVQLSSIAIAESLDGAKILEMEARRAQELTQLAHEAKVAEQQAKIAQATKRLRESGGYTRFTGFNENQNNRENVNRVRNDVGIGQSEMPGSYSRGLKEDDGDFEVPKLKAIDGRTAILRTKKYGTLAATPGTHLPDDFKVLSVDTKKGVTLTRYGVTYIAQFTWN